MRGGKRKGAGRPKSKKKTVSIRLGKIALYCLSYNRKKSETVEKAVEFFFKNKFPYVYKFALEYEKENKN